MLAGQQQRRSRGPVAQSHNKSLNKQSRGTADGYDRPLVDGLFNINVNLPEKQNYEGSEGNVISTYLFSDVR